MTVVLYKSCITAEMAKSLRISISESCNLPGNLVCDTARFDTLDTTLGNLQNPDGS